MCAMKIVLHQQTAIKLCNTIGNTSRDRTKRQQRNCIKSGEGTVMKRNFGVSFWKKKRYARTRKTC